MALLYAAHFSSAGVLNCSSPLNSGKAHPYGWCRAVKVLGALVSLVNSDMV